MNKKKLISGLKTLAALLIIALHIAPFYIMINMSLKSASERTSRWLPPVKLYIQNYFNAMETGKLLRALGNTFFIVLCAVVIIVVVGAMAAYPLSRKTTRRNRLILAVIVGIMMVPQLSVLVPLYKEMVAMGGINRYWGVILVSATFNLPMAIYMYSNFIGTIPKELDEAAKIDGCSYPQIFARVILPLITPALVTGGIFSFMWRWDDFLSALLYINKSIKYPVSLALKLFCDPGSSSDYGAMFAMASLSILPSVIIFIFFQKYLVEGISTSGLKG